MMSRSTLLVAAFAFAGAAVAADYTWQGGASGKWTEPSNWSVGGTTAADWPKGGDLAFFDSEATFTEDFDFGTGDLTVSNVTAATLTFDCSIAGEGGFNKRGDGPIHLKKANPFTGKFTSLGENACEWGESKGFSCAVYIYDSGSMGLLEAHLDCDKKAHGSRLHIMNDMTITIPVTISRDGIQQGGICIYGHAVTFTKPFSAPMRFIPDGQGGSMTFADTFTAGWFHPAAMTMTFQGKFKITSRMYMCNDLLMHLQAADNELYDCQLGGGDRLYLEAENALGSKFFVKFVKNSWFDLCGNDQKVTTISGWTEPPSLTDGNYGFTSSEPATLHLSGSGLEVPGFHGQFAGKAGLEWDSPKEFVFTSTSQDTRGAVTVTRGTVRMQNGVSFPHLGKLSVGAGGQFAMDADAGTFYGRSVEVATGGKLVLGANKELICQSAKLGDTELLDGTYGVDDKDLAAYFEGSDTSAKLIVDSHPLNEWTGGASGSWSDDGNWALGTKPGAGERVKITGAVSVTLDAATPELLDFELAGGATLMTSGWTSKLTATSVKVGAGCVLTTDGPFATAEDAPASRVWIVCRDLEIADGARLDVKGKGWCGGTSGTPGLCGISGAGFGPGAPLYGNRGASHGGQGADFDVSNGYNKNTIDRGMFGFVYDDPYAPTLPGSGAVSGGATRAGGGAVRIEATGAVTVDGVICADSPDATADGQYCGSGGSVWISCATFAGSGSVSANGGSGFYGAYPGFLSYYRGDEAYGYPGAGGGGMVRVECAAIGDLDGMKISAAPGYYVGNSKGKGRYAAVNHDAYRSDADLGTLTFGNNLVLDALLGKGLSGRLVGVTNYTYQSDMDWTWGHVRFAGEGATVAFGGDVTISGEDSRLEIGGIESGVRRTVIIDRYAGKKLNSCTIAGDLTLAGGAFDIRAAETNATMRWGGEVTVGGDLTVGAGGYLYPWCDVMNLGASHFTVGGAFTVEEGGTVMADRRGGAGGWNSGNQTIAQRGYLLPTGGRTFGFGLGGTSNRGSAHGGVGGAGWSETNGVGQASGSGCTVLCPDEWTADYPGAGGGAGGYGEGGEGGGLVYVEAKGAVTVNGTVTANGYASAYSGLGDGDAYTVNVQMGGGAGGGIYLSGASFAGSGTISARGGNATSGYVDGKPGKTVDYTGVRFAYVGGCGGGGRVVVRTGADVEGKTKLLKDVSSDYHSDAVVQELNAFTGSISVGGGTNIWNKADAALKGKSAPQFEQTYGGDGTVRFLRDIPAPGAILLVR